MNGIIPVLIYNLVQLAVTVLFGIFLGSSSLEIFIILATWITLRFMISLFWDARVFHYKSPVRCFIATIALFVSLFLTTKIYITVGLFAVIYTAIFLSSVANVKGATKLLLTNMFQWENYGDKKRLSKYQDLIDLIKKEPNNPIVLKYENYWKNNYDFRYDIFDMFFRQRMTYREITDVFDFTDNVYVRIECRIIYAALEVPLKLKPIEMD